MRSTTDSDDEERGLLSIAFPPDYAAAGYFYVFRTAGNPDGQVQVVAGITTAASFSSDPTATCTSEPATAATRTTPTATARTPRPSSARSCGSSRAPAQPRPATRSGTASGRTDGGVKTAVRKRRLLVRLRCTEACQVALGARLRKVRRLATRHRSLAANTRKTVRLQLSKALTRTIKRRRFVRIQVTVRATDAAGNTRTIVRRGRIKRR